MRLWERRMPATRTAQSRRRRPDYLYARLIQAVAAPGCPVCYLVGREHQKAFWILLWESVNDPGIRHDLRQSLGYCQQHAELLVQTAESMHDDVGVSILAQDWIETAADLLIRWNSSSRRPKIPERTCPACCSEADAVQWDLSGVIRWLSDPALSAGLRRAGGLCRVHLLQLPHVAGSRPLLEVGWKWVQRQQQAWAAGEAGSQEWLARARWFWGDTPLEPATEHPAIYRCPLCRVQATAEAAALAKPPVGGGMPCPRHCRWLLASPAGPAWLQDAYGGALRAAEAQLAEAYRAAEREHSHSWPTLLPGRALAPPAAGPLCPSCAAGREAAVAAARGLQNLGPGELLCLPHLHQVLKQNAAPALPAKESEALRRLARLLRRYVELSDWDHRATPRGEEQGAWAQARHFLCGPLRMAPPQMEEAATCSGQVLFR